MKWPAAVMLPPEPDAVLDRLASLAASTLQAPMAVLSLLSSDQQIVLPGAAGMPAPWQQDRVMAWTHSLCRHATTTAGLVVVDDVRTDARSVDYPQAITDFGVGAWIAVPLRFSSDFVGLFDTSDDANVDTSDDANVDTSVETSHDDLTSNAQALLARLEDVWSHTEPRRLVNSPSGQDSVQNRDEGRDEGRDGNYDNGQSVSRDQSPGASQGVEPSAWGVLCVMDTHPRQWSERDQELLTDLAAAAAAELRSRVLTSRAVAAERQMATALAASTAVHARSQLLLSLSRGLSRAETVGDVSDILTDLLQQQLHVDHFGLLLHDVEHHRARYVDMSTFPPGTDPAWAQFDLRAATAPAARAVADGVSFYCDDRDAVHATDPHLAEQGTWEFPGAVVIVPLLAGARHRDQQTLGALVLVWPTPRDTSDPADQALWTALADYTAQTLARVMQNAQRRAGAEQLQRSMLTALPEPDHLEIRARYVPAARGEEVGGDWYDAVLSPDGATTLVIGDVTGHDMAAAAQMGQLRSVLRTLIDAFDEPPAAILGRLEPANHRLGVHALATAVVARIEQDPSQTVAAGGGGWRRVRWSNAGHPYPVLLHPDGRTEILDSETDLLLGLNTGHRRHDYTVDLPPGSLLLLYTDGLIEHRGRSLDDGLDQLCAVLRRHAGATVNDLLDVLHEELIGADPDDDCAVLAIRMHPEDQPRPSEAGPAHTSIPPLKPSEAPTPAATTSPAVTGPAAAGPAATGPAATSPAAVSSAVPGTAASPARAASPQPSAPETAHEDPHGTSDSDRPTKTAHSDHASNSRTTELLLEPEPAAVRAARLFVHDYCCQLPECGEVCDTLELLVSEVVTNAFLHGRSQARLRVTSTPTSVRVEVSDDNSTMPSTVTADPEALGGRGLALVDALASAWGVRKDTIGKTVWVELAADTDGP